MPVLPPAADVSVCRSVDSSDPVEPLRAAFSREAPSRAVPSAPGTKSAAAAICDRRQID